MHTIVHSLEVIDQGQDVPVPHRNPFQDCDFISNHVLSASHESLVDDFSSIVSPCVDMDTFFDHRVTSSAQCLSSFISARLHLRLGLRRRSRSSVRSHI